MIKKSVTDPGFPVRWGGEGSALTLYFEKFQQNNFMKLKIEKVLRERGGGRSLDPSTEIVRVYPGQMTSFFFQTLKNK